MSKLTMVFERLAKGDRIKFYQDFYGTQWVELSRGRVLRRRQRLSLTPEEIQSLKDSLRKGPAAHAATGGRNSA